MKKAVFYHAGCPVCISAEQDIIGIIDRARFDLEIVHLGERPELISAAEEAGVKSVPALLLDENILHINYGASIEDVKNS